MGRFFIRNSCRLSLLSLALFFGLSAHADYLDWSIGLRGRSTDDSFSNAKVASLRTKLKGEKTIASTLKGSALVVMKLETGSSQSLFTNEFEPKSGILLAHGSLDWNPISFFTIRAGALYQDFESPLFITENSFPALQQVFEWENEKSKLSIDAQQAIPTSNTLSRRAVGKEETPTLFTGRIRASHYILDSTKLSARGTYFNFNKLTRGVAQDSRFYGNTVIGISSASEFFYNYRGVEFGGSVNQSFSKAINFEIGGSLINNNEAPSDRNQGQYAYAEIVWDNGDWQLAPKVEYYRNESDSTPGFYTAKEFGHNNRNGIGGALTFKMPGKFSVNARYDKSNLINQQPFQRDNFKFIEITVETDYARF